MIYFLNELPTDGLDKNSLYFISTEGENVELYVTDSSGQSMPVAADSLSTDQFSTSLSASRNAANGVAGLDASSKLSEAVMPSSFQTASQIQTTVQTEVNALVNSAPGALDTLDELANALGDDANFASTVTTQLAGKQATLSNATDVAKIGDGTFDGKPIVVVSQAEW